MYLTYTELDNTNVLRWIVVHNIRRHPHYQPPGRLFVVSAQEVYLRERSFYQMIYDFLRYFLFLALVLLMINIQTDYDVFLRNDSVYRQVFTDPQFKRVCMHVK